MKNKFIITTLVLFLLLNIPFFNVSSLDMNITHKNLNIKDIDEVFKPKWLNGTYWTYDMDFSFYYKKLFSVDATISEMKVIIIDKIFIENEKINVLFTKEPCKINGNVKIFGIDCSGFQGYMNTTAYISNETLGIKKFEFDVNGFYGKKNRDLFFNMTMNFVPQFDFLNFPFKVHDSWEVMIDNASIDVNAIVDTVLGEKKFNYSSYMDFIDPIKVDRNETILVPAGEYNSFVLKGEWGLSSDLWYAPEVGYLAKVDESIDINGTTANFYLELCDTNYGDIYKPKLEVEADDLSFELKKDKEDRRSIKIVNLAPEELCNPYDLIWSINIPEENNWLSISTQMFPPIAGGGNYSFDLIVNSTNMNPSKNPYIGQIHINSNGGNKTLPITLTVKKVKTKSNSFFYRFYMDYLSNKQFEKLPIYIIIDKLF